MQYIFFIVGGLFLAALLVYPFLGVPFEKKKSRIMNLYSSVLSDINKDHERLSIDPENIIKISVSILNFSRELYGFSRNSKNLNPEQILWLTGIIHEFSDALDLWMHRHADELKIQKKSLSIQEAEAMIGGKHILSLTEARLMTKIETLERILAT